MAILMQHPVSALAEKDFHRLDDQVMSMAFDLYNSIGNLWDEIDYKTRLRERCKTSGLEVQSEVPIKITHKNFQKSYFIDLLIEGTVYELKTAVGISSPHKSQTLNYLFLTNTQHGKIINFRPDSLEWRFVSTSLTADQRCSFVLKTAYWIADNPATERLRDLLSELLDSRGAYLDIQLYKEAVLFFMDQPHEYIHKRFCPLSSKIIIHFSSLTRRKESYQKNLLKYLTASTYVQVDWVNFDHNKIELHTLRNNNSATKLF